MYRRTLWMWAASCLLATVSACDTRPLTDPVSVSSRRDVTTLTSSLASEVRLLAATRGITALAPAPRVRANLVRLGQALAFDPIISGNKDISCMTCHVPAYGTGDGRSLSIGAGGVGLGPSRTHPQGVFIPRNAPPLFNLSAMHSMFWDGRVYVDANGTYHSPAGAQLTPAMTKVFEFGPLSAQPMFPPTSALEMRGSSGNELAGIPANDFTGIWAGIMKRLGAIPEYRALFEAAYPGTPFDSMTFAHASNAIAGFIVSAYSFTNTPWDRFLRGNDLAMSTDQLEGAKTFLTLKCSICHTGATLSDEQFHNVALAQIGPGQGNGPSGHDDFGRMNVSNSAGDLYRFRTSPLRNVELTAPYGHDGSIVNLRAFLDHYSESDLKLQSYDPSQLEALLQGTVVDNTTQLLAARDPLLDGVVFGPDILDKLMSYMSALTDSAARDLSRTVPTRVPSGLPVLPH